MAEFEGVVDVMPLVTPVTTDRVTWYQRVVQKMDLHKVNHSTSGAPLTEYQFTIDLSATTDSGGFADTEKTALKTAYAMTSGLMSYKHYAVGDPLPDGSSATKEITALLLEPGEMSAIKWGSQQWAAHPRVSPLLAEVYYFNLDTASVEAALHAILQEKEVYLRWLYETDLAWQEMTADDLAKSEAEIKAKAKEMAKAKSVSDLVVTIYAAFATGKLTKRDGSRPDFKLFVRGGTSVGTLALHDSTVPDVYRLSLFFRSKQYFTGDWTANAADKNHFQLTLMDVVKQAANRAKRDLDASSPISHAATGALEVLGYGKATLQASTAADAAAQATLARTAYDTALSKANEAVSAETSDAVCLATQAVEDAEDVTDLAELYAERLARIEVAAAIPEDELLEFFGYHQLANSDGSLAGHPVIALLMADLRMATDQGLSEGATLQSYAASLVTGGRVHLAHSLSVDRDRGPQVLRLQGKLTDAEKSSLSSSLHVSFDNYGPATLVVCDPDGVAGTSGLSFTSSDDTLVSIGTASSTTAIDPLTDTKVPALVVEVSAADDGEILLDSASQPTLQVRLGGSDGPILLQLDVVVFQFRKLGVKFYELHSGNGYQGDASGAQSILDGFGDYDGVNEIFGKQANVYIYPENYSGSQPYQAVTVPQAMGTELYPSQAAGPCGLDSEWTADFEAIRAKIDTSQKQIYYFWVWQVKGDAEGVTATASTADNSCQVILAETFQSYRKNAQITAHELGHAISRIYLDYDDMKHFTHGSDGRKRHPRHYEGHWLFTHNVLNPAQQDSDKRLTYEQGLLFNQGLK